MGKWLLLAMSTWLLLAGLPAAYGEEAKPRKKDQLFAFGESAYYQRCLKVTAISYSQGPGSLNPSGWVTMTVENHCQHPVGALRVALVMVDREGSPFGADLWLLEPGMMLRPGASWQDRYALPDGDGRLAEKWTLRVISAAGFPRQRGSGTR